MKVNLGVGKLNNDQNVVMNDLPSYIVVLIQNGLAGGLTPGMHVSCNFYATTPQYQPLLTLS